MLVLVSLYTTYLDPMEVTMYMWASRVTGLELALPRLISSPAQLSQ